MKGWWKDTQLMKHPKLGVSMPAVGLGTWQGEPGTSDEGAMIDSLVHALQNGYRLLDTAQIYGVEPIVGKALRKCGIPRKEITVVTKFWGTWHHDPKEALNRSLQNMGLDYIDVFLMHWPFANTPDWKVVRPNESPTIEETWRMMEDLLGPKCRAIGVSNFTQKTLDIILQSAKVVPAVNQIELHAFHPCLRLVPYCKSKGIHVMAWGTLGGGAKGPINEILTHDTFVDMAKAKGCSPGVISLSWAVQRGVTVIPKTKSKSRMDENISLVSLSEEEMDKINSAHQAIRHCRTADDNPRMEVWIDGKKTVQGWTAEDLGWEDEQGNFLT
ncbi:Putative aldo/keto reductase, aldo-keto reductase, NADP-dependent oxidoreductase [Colletotrichum destructivum]|uniref:Aldo/keto reductase, aldo-keto reductase, NADP-dependent oxidoreductase n=1 Tax=Colletotrichum destructivum TaxID=34406 RepID=A0AAX4I238_9PEZI|nr:Putative aldo/keto reductase, aldo-keto reductase, NADP-dependent oxidoreductase [Colletotrichum destructivum]